MYAYIVGQTILYKYIYISSSYLHHYWNTQLHLQKYPNYVCCMKIAFNRLTFSLGKTDSFGKSSNNSVSRKEVSGREVGNRDNLYKTAFKIWKPDTPDGGRRPSIL